MRTDWGDIQVDFHGQYYYAVVMGMEPKPPQGAQQLQTIAHHLEAVKQA